LFNQLDILLLDHIIIVSKHTVEAAGFIFIIRSRDPKSRSDAVLVFGTDFVCSIKQNKREQKEENKQSNESRIS
jgi:hypothetical protein